MKHVHDHKEVCFQMKRKTGYEKFKCEKRHKCFKRSVIDVWTL